MEKTLNPRFVSQAMLAAQYIKMENHNDLHCLDVGASYGDFAVTLRKLGLSPKCYALEQGVEYQKKVSDLGIQILVAKDEFLALDTDWNQKFDLITMSHVLEHFNAGQLQKILKNLRSYLKAEGVLLCEVPNDDHRKIVLEQNQAPHLSFFSKESLEKFFLDNGFSILFSSAVGAELSKAPYIEETQINEPEKSIKSYLKKQCCKFAVLQPLLKLRSYLNYPYRWIRAYFHQVPFNELLLTPNFQYRKNGDCLRICVAIQNDSSCKISRAS